MTEQRAQLFAYLATLVALVTVFVASLIVAAISPDVLGKLELFGLGTVTGGLIGVLRIPAQRSVSIDQPSSQPVPVQDADKGDQA